MFATLDPPWVMCHVLEGYHGSHQVAHAGSAESQHVTRIGLVTNRVYVEHWLAIVHGYYRSANQLRA